MKYWHLFVLFAKEVFSNQKSSKNYNSKNALTNLLKDMADVKATSFAELVHG